MAALIMYVIFGGLYCAFVWTPANRKAVDRD